MRPIKLYVTEVSAIDPRDGEMKSWGGPLVPGRSFDDARRHCQENGLGYCRVVGELVAEIPQSRNEFPALEAGQRN